MIHLTMLEVNLEDCLRSQAYERSPEHDFGGLDFAGQQVKPEV